MEPLLEANFLTESPPQSKNELPMPPASKNILHCGLSEHAISASFSVGYDGFRFCGMQYIPSTFS